MNTPETNNNDAIEKVQPVEGSAWSRVTVRSDHGDSMVYRISRRSDSWPPRTEESCAADGHARVLGNSARDGSIRHNG